MLSLGISTLAGPVIGCVNRDHINLLAFGSSDNLVGDSNPHHLPLLECQAVVFATQISINTGVVNITA